MTKLESLWYNLTAKFPRKLPTTELEYCRLKDILLQAFNLPDEPATWITVAGVVTSTPSLTVRRPLSHIVSHVRRLSMNKIAHDDKVRSMKELDKKLLAAIDKESAKLAAEDAAKALTPVLEGELEPAKAAQS